MIIKQTVRKIKNSLGKFLSVLLISALGVGFFAGIRETSVDMLNTADAYYDKENLMDIKLVSPYGFSQEEIDSLKNDAIDIFPSNYIDLLYKSDAIRIHNYSEDINVPTLKSGRLIQNDGECLADANYFKIGDRITLESDNLKVKEYEVVGLVSSSLYIGIEMPSTTIGNGKIKSYIFIPNDHFNIPFSSTLYIKVKGSNQLKSYSDKYVELIDQEIAKLNLKEAQSLQKSRLQAMYPSELEPLIYTFNRNDDISYLDYENDALRVDSISKVFPIFFLLVAMLICLNTMTRMVEEERGEIGTLKSLGYSNRSILFRYILYIILATVIGSIVGVMIGCNVLPRVIYQIYEFIYYLPNLVIEIDWILISLIIFGMTLAMIAVTIYVYHKTSKENPANLLRPKSPLAGKKVFLEHIPFIWNKLNFSRKVTVRNILRYKKRIYMTVLGIAGCTALTLTGFGLRDSIIGIVKLQFEEITHYKNMAVLKEETIELSNIKGLLEENGLFDSTLIYQNTFKFKNDDRYNDVYVIVPSNPVEYENFITLRDRKSKNNLNLSDDGVIITEKMAILLGAQIDEYVTIYDIHNTAFDVKVVGITENYAYNYLYMTSAYYEKVMNKTLGYNIVVSDSFDIDHEKATSNLLKTGKFLNVNFTLDTIHKFDQMVDNLDKIVYVILLCSCMLGFIVLYNLTTINITERTREISTLKVLGFYDREVSNYVYRETIILTVLGALTGLILGVFLHQFVIKTAEMDYIMFQRNINMPSYVYAFFVTIIFSLIVQIFTHFKLKKIDMIESLKSVE